MFDLQEEQLNGDIEKKYLLVEISDTLYAFGIVIVKEVLPMIEVFSVDSEKNIAGIIKLRGENIPVFDFRATLGKEPLKLKKQQKLLILILNSEKIAVIVDNLIDIMSIDEQKIFDTALSEKYIRTTILDNKRISFIDSHEFYKNVISHLDLPNPEKKLLPIEQKSLSLIKTRTEILNKEDEYVISDDTFINEKFVVFRLNDEIYAFNILYVEEIKKIEEDEVSKIPCVPGFIRGIINAKGDYLSLVDIKPFLNMSILPLPSKVHAIIINVNGLRIALLVDEIFDVEQLPIARMVSSASYESSFIKGEISREELLINMLDVEKIFSSQNINIENYDVD